MTTQNHKKVLSNSKIKYINSLKLKKFRDQHNQFIAEGEKLVSEILKSSFNIITLIATDEFLSGQENLIKDKKINEVIEVRDKDLERISALKSTNNVLAVVNIPIIENDINDISNTLSLLLEDIRDPGNLGTIIRIADWFGISNLFCTHECVDVYNPKVIQATMGSVCRVKVHYIDPEPILSEVKKIKDFHVYGTFMEGRNIYEADLDSKGIIILGNESRGISDNIAGYVTDRLVIPNYKDLQDTSESLNVAVAAGIVCSEFRRRLN